MAKQAPTIRGAMAEDLRQMAAGIFRIIWNQAKLSIGVSQNNTIPT